MYGRIARQDELDYETLKQALLKRYNKTEEGYKHKFYTAKDETGEVPQQFMARLDSYIERWTELAKIEKSFEGLKNLMVREQFLSVCTKDLEVYLREKSLLDLKELAKIAEQYMEAHRYKSLGYGKTALPKQEKKDVLKQEVTPVVRETRVCNHCGIKGHIFKDCYKRKKGVQMAAAMKFQGDKSAEKAESKTWRKTVNTGSAYSKHQTGEVRSRCR